MKGYVLNEVIDNIGKGLTNSIDEMFGLYGIGEGINVYKQFREDRKSENKPDFMDYSGRFARMAPLAAPFISYATGGDFFKSIMIPAAVCIGVYGIEYLVNTREKNNK
ncbi:MAG: hypothetical protein QXN71_03935 [Candidatus Aenigmatarchaeota archaeon]